LSERSSSASGAVVLIPTGLPVFQVTYTAMQLCKVQVRRGWGHHARTSPSLQLFGTLGVKTFPGELKLRATAGRTVAE